MYRQSVLRPIDTNTDQDPPCKRMKIDHNMVEEKEIQWSPDIKRDTSPNNFATNGINRLDCDSNEITQKNEETFYKNDDLKLMVSCSTMSPTTRQKQFAILESTLTKTSQHKLANGEFNDLLQNSSTVKITDKNDYFMHLSDEIILCIFQWLPKSKLVDVAVVCKRFNRLTQDETLWTRMDAKYRQLRAGYLGKILSRQVIVLRLAQSEIIEPPILPGCKAYLSDFQSRVLYLDLSMAHISLENLCIVFTKCKRLKKLSLENVPINDDVLIALSENTDIEVINFAMCTGFGMNGLQYLFSKCKELRELNMSWTHLNSNQIKLICNKLPLTMDRLNLSGCRKMLLDEHVESLVKNCPKLRELDLSDCTSITNKTISSIATLEALTALGLSRCYLIQFFVLSQLKNLPKFSFLDIHGGHIESDEFQEIQEQLGNAISINKFKFSSVARPTFGNRRSTIWGMRVKD